MSMNICIYSRCPLFGDDVICIIGFIIVQVVATFGCELSRSVHMYIRVLLVDMSKILRRERNGVKWNGKHSDWP